MRPTGPWAALSFASGGAVYLFFFILLPLIPAAGVPNAIHPLVIGSSFTTFVALFLQGMKFFPDDLASFLEPPAERDRLLWYTALLPLVCALLLLVCLAMGFNRIWALVAAYGLGAILLFFDRFILWRAKVDTEDLDWRTIVFPPLFYFVPRRMRLDSSRAPERLWLGCLLIGPLLARLLLPWVWNELSPRGRALAEARQALEAGRFSEARGAADRVARDPGKAAPVEVAGLAGEILYAVDREQRVRKAGERGEAAAARAMSPESRNRADLERLRAALSAYRRDQGAFPDNLAHLVERGYLPQVPAVALPSVHPETSEVYYLERLDAPVQESGQWAYVNERQDKDFGAVFINCTHTDNAGKHWDSY